MVIKVNIIRRGKAVRASQCITEFDVLQNETNVFEALIIFLHIETLKSHLTVKDKVKYRMVKQYKCAPSFYNVV